MAELSTLADEALDMPGVSRRPEIMLLGIARVGRLTDRVPKLPGVDTHLAPGTLARADNIVLVAPAPGEWLLMGAASDLGRYRNQGAGFLVADLTDGRTILRLAPEAAAPALAAYSPIDPAVLKSNGCAQTLFGDARALLVTELDGGLLLICEAALEAYVLFLLKRCSGL